MKFDCKKMHPKCKAGCCGIVPIPKEIYDRNKDKINRVPANVIDMQTDYLPLTLDAYCPFLSDDLQCNIYDDRPPLCRKFGDESHPMLFCPYLDKEGKERSRQQRRQIERNSEKVMNKLRVIE